MATENMILDLPFVAAVDLTACQYNFVFLASDGSGVGRPTSETQVCVGILQNAPAAGAAAEVRVMGVSKLAMNAAIGIGTFVKQEYVSGSVNGRGKDATSALGYARGFVLEASGAADDVGSVLLLPMCPSIAAFTQPTTITTDATAGPRTWTIAEMLGGMLRRDTGVAARSDVTPTAAQIIAGIPGAIITSSFRFVIQNTSGANHAITLTAGDGNVTLVGTMTIAQNNSREFLVVVTGAATVSIISLGADSAF